MAETCPICNSNQLSNLIRRKDNRWIKQCRRCSHCFIPISKDRRWLQEIYDSDYDYSSTEESEARRISDEWFRDPEGHYQVGLRWLKQARPLKELRILEIGCGLGHFIASLQEAGAQTHGIDGNPSVAPLAKKWFGLEIQIGQIEEWVPRLPQEHYDVATLFEVIEHLADPLQTLRTLRDKLANKGHLLISTPNFSLFWSERSGYPDLSRRFEHIQFFQLQTLTALLERAGFKVVTRLPCGPNHPLTERLLIRSNAHPFLSPGWSSLRKLSFIRTPVRTIYRWMNRLSQASGWDKQAQDALFVVAQKGSV